MKLLSPFGRFVRYGPALRSWIVVSIVPHSLSPMRPLHAVTLMRALPGLNGALPGEGTNPIGMGQRPPKQTASSVRIPLASAVR